MEQTGAMREYLSFVLNGEPQWVRGLDPSTTLLDYLRRERRLMGTKEGCAEGDCGACTVTVGELGAGGVRYRALNACILLMPMLEGRSVTTVEHLRGKDGSLHPVQQALVDTHGSQCGYCTPGFVMSLYTAYLNQPGSGTTPIDDLLAGNLCRCTGYGPIINAARAIYDHPRPPGETEAGQEAIAQLHAVAHCEAVALTGAGSRFYAPTTLDDLAELCEQHPDATILSGATDVGLWITKQHRRIPAFIHTGRVRELQTISQDGNMLRIGAGVPWAELQEALGRHYPDFGELLRRFGSVQVRNAATIGGNIANGSPVGDGPPALIALGASLVLRKGAARRTLALDAYFLAYGKQDRCPGELIEAIEVPITDPPERLKCYKVSKRFDQDIATVCGCLNVDIADGAVRTARIAFGGMAGTPRRATHVEAALAGRSWTHAAVIAALPAFERDFAPISDMRGSAAYRMQVAKNLLIKYFYETERPLRETRLVGHGAAFT
ncbi:MAG TPA: xanthine dehydrogenase small subunit [Hyphomicrobiaceae bacterium]|jgi:xanthine dehydrogenase small subunit|nr:xanthine dehydrogenase small subunit [Hyphomicrobiaceae bacterium]